jgi:hypothetical protein
MANIAVIYASSSFSEPLTGPPTFLSSGSIPPKTPFFILILFSAPPLYPPKNPFFTLCLFIEINEESEENALSTTLSKPKSLPPRPSTPLITPSSPSFYSLKLMRNRRNMHFLRLSPESKSLPPRPSTPPKTPSSPSCYSLKLMRTLYSQKPPSSSSSSSLARAYTLKNCLPHHHFLHWPETTLSKIAFLILILFTVPGLSPQKPSSSSSFSSLARIYTLKNAFLILILFNSLNTYPSRTPK